MFLKVSRTNTNKLISYVDRYFTWDRRTLKREGQCTLLDFYGVREDDGIRTVVVIDRMQGGNVFMSIRKNDSTIYSDFAKSYKDIDIFKRMVRCLG